MWSPSFHIGGGESPSLAIGDSYCAISNCLTIGNYTYPGAGTQLYVNGNSTLNGGLNVTGSVSGTGITNLLSPYATISSLSSYVLTSSLPANSITATAPLLAIGDGVTTNISFNSSRAITCNGVTSNLSLIHI